MIRLESVQPITAQTLTEIYHLNSVDYTNQFINSTNLEY